MSIENAVLSTFAKNWERSGRIALMAASSDDGFNTPGKIRRHIRDAAAYERRVAPFFANVAELVEKRFLQSNEMVALGIKSNAIDFNERDFQDMREAMKSKRNAHVLDAYVELMSVENGKQMLARLSALRSPILNTALETRASFSTLNLNVMPPGDAAQFILELTTATLISSQMWRWNMNSMISGQGATMSNASSAPEESQLSYVLRSLPATAETEYAIGKELDRIAAIRDRMEYFPERKLRETGLNPVLTEELKRLLLILMTNRTLARDVWKQRAAIRSLLSMPVGESPIDVAGENEIPWGDTIIRFEDGTTYRSIPHVEQERVTANNTDSIPLGMFYGSREVFPNDAVFAPVSESIDAAYLPKLTNWDTLHAAIRTAILRGRTQICRLASKDPSMFTTPFYPERMIVQSRETTHVYGKHTNAKGANVPAGWTADDTYARDAMDLFETEVVGARKSNTVAIAAPAAPTPLEDFNDMPQEADCKIREILKRRGFLRYSDLTHILKTLGVGESTQGKGSHQSLHTENGQGTISKRVRDSTESMQPNTVFRILNQLKISKEDFLVALRSFYKE